MKRVIVESPFAGDIEANLAYVRKCMHDCLKRGESPFASHALYTQPGVLLDDVPEERKLGIQAGFEWRKVADLTIFYLDLGVSSGMRLGFDHCMRHNLLFEVRAFLDRDASYLIKSFDAEKFVSYNDAAGEIITRLDEIYNKISSWFRDGGQEGREA